MVFSRTIWAIAFAFVAIPSQAAEPERLNADETRAFMKDLARYVFENHLKRDDKSPQRGMLYEYFDPTKKGKLGQWVQGEALDTMHDGAWFVSALAQAYRATGDPYYLQFIEQWTLPFYLKMLNHSDELFSPDRDDSDGALKFNKEHMLQKGEKGFVPYWWDDGASISLEANRRKTGKASYPARDDLAGQPNSEQRLSGYCLGCSNHMAQDLAVMLMAVWPLAKEDTSPLVKLRGEIKYAARNLYESRLKHHGHIGPVDAMQALINNDAEAAKHIPVVKEWIPNNDYTRILHDYKPGQRYQLPAFTDGQEYTYWQWVVRAGGKPDYPGAMATIYDACTLPMLFKLWSDNHPPEPGMNRFDLANFPARDGRLESYRSDRPGPTGSRFGPQNMIGCARALQLLDTLPGLWDERRNQKFAKDLRVPFSLIDKQELNKLTFSETGDLGKGKVHLSCNDTSLAVGGEIEGDTADIVLCSLPDGKGKQMTITITKQSVSAKDDEGQKLLTVAGTAAAVEGRTKYAVMIPIRAVKQQTGGWNPIVQGRHSIKLGDQVRNFYITPTEKLVKETLERELAGGLATWRSVFAKKGYIPTGITEDPAAKGKWDYSDTGGYAHLLAAGAQHLLYLNKQRDWEQKLTK